MLINGKHYRSIWFDKSDESVKILNQSKLPYEIEIKNLVTLDDFASAIADMWVRGAPLIGATAAYGFAEAIKADSSDSRVNTSYDVLYATRPTAINLKWALSLVFQEIRNIPQSQRYLRALNLAHKISDQDVETNSRLGEHGAKIISSIAENKARDEPVKILTHCNAGWLATVDWGTATSPIYHAEKRGIKTHVFVDETRPRNQGALTAWELNENGVSHEYIVDNAGGHLMQHGKIDLVIVGTDRTTASGDVCNKVGTYLKALAAYDNNIPFYVALPSSTIDWTINDGLKEIPIEERSHEEVTHVQGLFKGKITSVRVTPETSRVSNYAFDVTPAHLVTGLITERGISPASAEGLKKLFPEKA